MRWMLRGLLLAIAMVLFGLAACGDEESGESTDSGKSDVSEGTAYEVSATFGPGTPEITNGTDVRVAGVLIGTVVELDAGPKPGTTKATIRVKPKYAPVCKNARLEFRRSLIDDDVYLSVTAPAKEERPIIGERAWCADRE